MQGFPFESLGVVAFFILFVMAATSHDFWNANLGPGAWKFIHMGVYLAYLALVAHVMLGFVQSEKSVLYPVLIGVGAGWLALVHLLAAAKSSRGLDDAEAGWIKVATTAEFTEGRARIVTPEKGERIAVFLHKGRFSAVSNVCRHQGGPLGEGKVVDDCITCPWHGFQYRLEDGQSPAPFTEKISTYNLKLEGGTVFVHEEPNEPGTPTKPVALGPEAA
ncbi:MAG: Rieske 2Fe-2S domain-containing protein [Parvularculaceae bacterium]|nr:Rieske 2Fe-2S domain-containing protein [Parvularculaceae bacterium]